MYHQITQYGDSVCSKGLDIDKAATFALNEGFAPLISVEYPNYYPFTNDVICVSQH
jgi:hypothetical protein